MYYKEIKKTICLFYPKSLNKYFIFGSSVKRNKYNDIDIGIIGNKKSQLKLFELREKFYDSSIPYKVDVIDFDDADYSFKNYVLKNEPKIWIK